MAVCSIVEVFCIWKSATLPISGAMLFRLCFALRLFPEESDKPMSSSLLSHILCSISYTKTMSAIIRAYSRNRVLRDSSHCSYERWVRLGRYLVKCRCILSREAISHRNTGFHSGDVYITLSLTYSYKSCPLKVRITWSKDSPDHSSELTTGCKEQNDALSVMMVAQM